jgi:hypothetical protein
MEHANFFKDNLLKDDFSDHEDQFPKNIEKKDEPEEQGIKANELIFCEEFDKAFKNAFINKNTCEVYDDIENPPIISDENDIYKSIKGCHEEKVIINVEEEKKEDKYFPFTKGVGLEKTLNKIGLQIKDNTSPTISSSSDGTNQLHIVTKFKTTHYFKDETGKKKKKKKQRKFKPDDIRKKIKARFHKIFRNILNKKIIKAGGKKSFNCFPQCFITNITIKLNKKVLDLTYEKLIEQSYISGKNEKESSEKIDIKNYNKNLEVLKYLQENSEISKKSEFEKIKNMKYQDILKAFFISKEFEDTLIMLYDKKEKVDYIEEYINRALTYVNFFANNKKYSRNNTFQISLDNDEEEKEDELIEEEGNGSGYECE